MRVGCRSFRPAASAKEITIEETAGEEGLYVTADNEIYAARGYVQVAAVQQGSNVEITANDNGPGIAAGDLPRIFDCFYRGHNGMNHEPGPS